MRCNLVTHFMPRQWINANIYISVTVDYCCDSILFEIVCDKNEENENFHFVLLVWHSPMYCATNENLSIIFMWMTACCGIHTHHFCVRYYVFVFAFVYIRRTYVCIVVVVTRWRRRFSYDDCCYTQLLLCFQHIHKRTHSRPPIPFDYILRGRLSMCGCGTVARVFEWDRDEGKQTHKVCSECIHVFIVTIVRCTSTWNVEPRVRWNDA